MHLFSFSAIVGIMQTGDSFMIDYISVGRRIKFYRKSKGYTQSDLADIIGVTNKFISQVECGRTEISLKRLDELAAIFGIKTHTFIIDSDPEYDEYMNSELYNKICSLTSEKKILVSEIIDVIMKQ